MHCSIIFLKAKNLINASSPFSEYWLLFSELFINYGIYSAEYDLHNT